jgi:predicted acylesterase/phospholipase RssA
MTESASPEDSIYDVFRTQIIPSLRESAPLLVAQIGTDSYAVLGSVGQSVWEFVLPEFLRDRAAILYQDLGESEILWSTIDSNGDGYICSEEFSKLYEAVGSRSQSTSSFWTAFFIDWKIAIFMWRTFGGIIMLSAVLSIVPGQINKWLGKILVWPLLVITYSLTLFEVLAYFSIRLIIKIAESVFAAPKHRARRNKMINATSYEEWYEHGAALDIVQRRYFWRRSTRDSTRHRYNWELIREWMETMKRARTNKDLLGALAVLQQCTLRNVGGILSKDLFCFTNTGETKFIVQVFVNEVSKTLEWVTDEALKLDAIDDDIDDRNGNAPEVKVKFEQRLQRKVRQSMIMQAPKAFRQESMRNLGSNSMGAIDEKPEKLPHFRKEELVAFLKRARAAYGRTALCLSGGAMMGSYHYGHLRGLMETGCLPQIISGTSAGSVIGCIICTRTDEELRRDLTPEVIGTKMKCFKSSWTDRIKCALENQTFFREEEWLEMIKWFTCGDMTFEEAYKKTGRILCISLTGTTKQAPPRLMTYLTAPNVMIGPAVIASAAVPGLVKPVRMKVKDPDGTIRYAGDQTYVDGSLQNDIPTDALAEQFNVQFFVVAQCNPHIVPYFFNARGGVGEPSRWSSGDDEASWRGGYLLAALEVYLKTAIRSRMKFLNEMGADRLLARGFDQDFHGSATLVPQVRPPDYLKVRFDLLLLFW